MSVSSIQGSTGSSYIEIEEEIRRRKAQLNESPFTRNTGADTVFISEEALALMQNSASSSTEKDSSENEQKLQTVDATSISKNTDQPSSLKKSMFSMLLESIFLNDLEKNGSFSSKTSEASNTTETSSTSETQKTALSDIEDQQKASSIKVNKGSKDITKLINKAVSGKADLGDFLTALGSTQKSTTAKNGSEDIAKLLSKAATGKADSGNVLSSVYTKKEPLLKWKALQVARIKQTILFFPN